MAKPRDGGRPISQSSLGREAVLGEGVSSSHQEAERHRFLFHPSELRAQPPQTSNSQLSHMGGYSPFALYREFLALSGLCGPMYPTAG